MEFPPNFPLKTNTEKKTNELWNVYLNFQNKFQ